MRFNDYHIHIRYIGEVCFDMKSDKAVTSGSDVATITPIQLIDLVLHQYYSLPDRYFSGGYGFRRRHLLYCIHFSF